MAKLNAQQNQFCFEYVACNEGKAAAIKAGYSSKTAEQQASRLLSIVKVQEEIKRLRSEQEKRTLVTADFVILGLKEVFERCMQRHAVMIRDGKDWKQKTEFVEHEDGTVTEEGVWEFDATGANRALELLGKHLNIFHENDTLKNLLKDTEISFTKHYDKK